MSAVIEIRVPNIGDFQDIPIMELRVRAGDMVAADDGDGSTFQPRLMLPLSLGWDHRVIDGAAACRSYYPSRSS